jgi:hypothetical protein
MALTKLSMRFSTFIHLLQQLGSLQESLEILSDPQTMAALRASEEDIKAERLTPWEDYKRERGLLA